MLSITTRVQEYVSQLPNGEVFTFSQVVDEIESAQKDTVHHALKKLARNEEILHMKKGVYLKSGKDDIELIRASLPSIVRATAENIHAKVYPSQSSALRMLGITEDSPVRYTYVATKRIAPFLVYGISVSIQYSRTVARLERILSVLNNEEKETIIILIISLEYLGEERARALTDVLLAYISSISPVGRHLLYVEFVRALKWAQFLIEREPFPEADDQSI